MGFHSNGRKVGSLNLPQLFASGGQERQPLKYFEVFFFFIPLERYLGEEGRVVLLSLLLGRKQKKILSLHVESTSFGLGI